MDVLQINTIKWKKFAAIVSDKKKKNITTFSQAKISNCKYSKIETSHAFLFSPDRRLCMEENHFVK